MPDLKDDSLMPFGKHQGKKMANVPAGYLLWLNDQPWVDGNVKAYIHDNIEALRKEP